MVAVPQITISADKIIMDGQTIATTINANKAQVDNLMSGSLLASKLYAVAMEVAAGGTLQLDSYSNFLLHGSYADWQSDTVVTGVTLPSETQSDIRYFVYANNNDINDLRTVQGQIITAYNAGSGPSYKTLYYLGRSGT